MGFLALAEVIGSWLTTIVTMAVFTRETTAHPVMFIIDEWQIVVGKSASELERTLSQARFRKVNLVLANQTLGQITDPSLLRSLLTNISVSWAFRPAEKDIEHVFPLLPITGRCLDPERPDQFLSKEAERRKLLDRLTKLRPRHALLSDLVAGRADIVRTLSVPYQEAKRRSADVALKIREACRRGRFGIPFRELQKQSERGTSPPKSPERNSLLGVQHPNPPKPTRIARPRLVLP